MTKITIPVYTFEEFKGKVVTFIVNNLHNGPYSRSIDMDYLLSYPKLTNDDLGKFVEDSFWEIEYNEMFGPTYCVELKSATFLWICSGSDCQLIHKLPA